MLTIRIEMRITMFIVSIDNNIIQIFRIKIVTKLHIVNNIEECFFKNIN